MQVDRSEVQRALSLLDRAKELHSTWPINPFTFLDTPSVDLAAMRRHHLSWMLGDLAYEEAEVSERAHVDGEGKGRFYHAEVVVMKPEDFAALKVQLRNILEFNNPILSVLSNLPSDEDLEAMIKKSAGHEMTEEELREQRISFVHGQLMECAPDVTKEEVRALHDKTYGGPKG